MAVPPLAPGSQPLAGSTTVDLLGNSLTQWATHVQDATSGMILPPEVAVNCPQADIVGVLNRLEGLTWVRYCRHCFRVGQKCRCSAIPHQAPGQESALWTPPMMSYMAMASSTETTASSSAAGVTPPSYPPPGMPSLEPMDTLLAPTSENLLATAGVGRGSRGRSQPRAPTTPGVCQMRAMVPQQWVPTPRRQEMNQVTPYRQQVYLPRHATPKPSTTPSTSQGCKEPAREDEDARGRSSSRGPQSRHWRNRSSTRGSRKCRRGIQSDNPMDEMSNYVASGWKRDLTYIIGCCWVAQVGPLDSEEWEVALCKFLVVMRNRRAVEWMDIKELIPLQFMPYVADLFKDITGKDLQDLSGFTGWIGIGGYYHWKVAQLGLLHACPHLQGQSVPKGPMAQPSGQPHPQRLTQTGTLATGASGRHQDGVQPTSDWGGKKSTSNQGGKTSTSNQGGKTSTSSQGKKTSNPRQSGKLASTGRGEKPTTSGSPVDLPPEREGVGNGAWTDWYQRTLWGAEGGMPEPQGPPYLIGTVQVRQEAIGQIYNSVDGKDPPP